MHRDHVVALDLRNDIHFFRLLAESYLRLVGHPLIPESVASEYAAQWLYEDASFAILAHDTSDDPRFVYGNKAAQKYFEYDWDELTALPSRLSAEMPERDARHRFLQQVKQDGYVSDYSGIRIAKSGRRFRIDRATVWQLMDEKGAIHGQAAKLPQVTDL